MTPTDYIKKQITEHLDYCNSIKETNCAFSAAFINPKNGCRITWSEKCTLIEINLDKITKRIESKKK